MRRALDQKSRAIQMGHGGSVTETDSSSTGNYLRRHPGVGKGEEPAMTPLLTWKDLARWGALALTLLWLLTAAVFSFPMTGS